jgi:hypothetical protein
MIAALLILSTLSTVDLKEDTTVHNHYDLLILNHVYRRSQVNELGTHSIDQMCFCTIKGNLTLVEDWRQCRGRKKYTKEERAVKLREMRDYVWKTYKIDAEDENLIPEWMGHSMVPIYNERIGKYEAVFFDGNVRRRITCTSFRIMHTQYDFEVMNRKILPVALRRKLSIYSINGPLPYQDPVAQPPVEVEIE